MNEKLITVTERGSIQVVPDVTRLELKLQSRHDTYTDAYAQAAKNTECLSEIMAELKLDPSLLKTTNFEIEKKTTSRYDRNDNYIGDKFHGFDVDHRIKIDLGMDNLMVSNIIHKIGEKLKHAEINLGHTVRDPRPAQLKMLESAVRNAKEKAAIMAQAADCTLGAVKEINYSKQELDVYSHYGRLSTFETECSIGSSPTPLDITPDDFTISDSVTVVWYLSDSASK